MQGPDIEECQLILLVLCLLPTSITFNVCERVVSVALTGRAVETDLRSKSLVFDSHFWSRVSVGQTTHDDVPKVLLDLAIFSVPNAQ